MKTAQHHLAASCVNRRETDRQRDRETDRQRQRQRASVNATVDSSSCTGLVELAGPHALSSSFPSSSFIQLHCIVQLGLLPWEIQVAFPRKSQLRQSRTTQLTVHAGCFSVSIIHRTLTTWATGSLTCVQMLMHAIALGGVRTPSESLH